MKLFQVTHTQALSLELLSQQTWNEALGYAFSNSLLKQFRCAHPFSSSKSRCKALNLTLS